MNQLIRFQLFGWPEVTYADTRIEGFVSDKARALLFYLVVSGKSHARQRLMTLFWGDMAEVKARGNLRTALYTLQQILPPCLIVDRKSVAFDTTFPHEVDLHLFEQLLAAPEPAPVHLRAALDLYSGDFLEGFSVEADPEYEKWVLVECERLRLMAIKALETLSSYELAQGSLEAASSLLNRLLSLEEWHEKAHHSLMLVYARNGQYDQALRQYEEYCRILEHELAIEPARQTQQLYERILQARQDQRPALPRVSSAVGRTAEIAEVSAMLRNPEYRLLSIRGPGGIGKTHVAMQIAHQLEQYFLNGVAFVPLAAVDNPAFMLTAIAQACRIHFIGQGDARQQLIDYFRQREMLLIFDAYEHLLDDVSLLMELLAQAPQLSILVTSRERLNLRAEWVFELQGLTYPTHPLTAAQPWQDYAALVLFEQVARRGLLTFDIQAELPAVTQICRFLEGIPLGIEIAAALTSSLSCEQLARQISIDLDTLVAPWRDMPERHRTLRIVFEHSWHRLSSAEQATLASLAVFHGSWTLEAAQAVCGASPGLLERLVDASLIHLDQNPSHDQRYHLHTIIAQYARAMLARDYSFFVKIQTDHASYYLHLLATQAANRIVDQYPWLIMLAADIDNIHAAWKWAVSQTEVDLLLGGIKPLHQLYETLSWFEQGWQLFSFAVNHFTPLMQAPAAAHVALAGAKIFASAAGLALRAGHIQAAHDLAQTAVLVFEQLEIAEEQAFSLNTLGISLLYQGDFAQAQTVLQNCADIYQQIDPSKMGKPLANLGSLCARIGDYERAKHVLSQGIELSRRYADLRGLAHFLTNLGFVHQECGELTTARTYYLESLTVCDETDYLSVKLVTLFNLAEIAFETQAFADAHELAQQAINLAHAIADRRTLARVLKFRGTLAATLDDYQTAWKTLHQALSLAQDLAEPPIMLDVLDGVATVHMRQGQHQAAASIATMIIHHPAAEQQNRLHAQQVLGLLPATLTANAAQPPTQELHPFVEMVLSMLQD